MMDNNDQHYNMLLKFQKARKMRCAQDFCGALAEFQQVLAMQASAKDGAVTYETYLTYWNMGCCSYQLYRQQKRRARTVYLTSALSFFTAAWNTLLTVKEQQRDDDKLVVWNDIENILIHDMKLSSKQVQKYHANMSLAYTKEQEGDDLLASGQLVGALEIYEEAITVHTSVKADSCGKKHKRLKPQKSECVDSLDSLQVAWIQYKIASILSILGRGGADLLRLRNCLLVFKSMLGEKHPLTLSVATGIKSSNNGWCDFRKELVRNRSGRCFMQDGIVVSLDRQPGTLALEI